MSGDKNYTTIIAVKEELRIGGYWVITSSDLPGLLLAGKDITALREDIPVAIKQLFLLNYDMNVFVSPVIPSAQLTQQHCDHIAHPKTWAAIKDVAA